MQPVDEPTPGPIQPVSADATSFGISFGSARTAIVDTDHLLDQVVHLVDDPERAFALLGPPFGRERTFASAHVLTELYQADKLGHRNKWEKLAAQAKARGLDTDPGQYRDAFETRLLPRITFVDVTGMFEEDPATEAVRATDHKDAPTAQLAVLLSRTRPLVYSRDKSLWRPGLAPQPAIFQAVLAAGRQADAGESTVTAATYVAVGAVWAVDGAARRVAAVFRIPDWLTRLALLGTAVLLLLGKERRDKMLNFLAPAGRFVLTAMEQANTAAGVLANSAARVRADTRLECRIAEVLSQQPDDTALLAGEVQEKLRYRMRTGEAPTVTEVREVLRQYPCFVEGPRHRFRLGTRYQLG